MFSISMDNSYILPLGAARFSVSVSKEVADFDVELKSGKVVDQIPHLSGGSNKEDRLKRKS